MNPGGQLIKHVRRLDAAVEKVLLPGRAFLDDRLITGRNHHILIRTKVGIDAGARSIVAQGVGDKVLEYTL